MNETEKAQQKIKEWIERNPDIPYYTLKNGPCAKCGKLMWTEQGLLHYCVTQK